MESVGKIRFKINHENHEIITYFEKFFKLVEQNLRFKVKLQQTYNNEQKEVLCFVTNTPKLLNSNTYEPNDIYQLLMLLSMDAHNFCIQSNKLENLTFNDRERKDNELNIDS
ncbi:uncharacterized protein LOC112686672 [Sipha flava]|uniref:Uncharacterized protein LOC112686672 n=2 Tax=Sipha flava TaxID=143950 RepID=A0A8B8FWY1_9HEMI|nr:uncharacterized protein LOC112686672 [Sipha flava]